VSSSFRTQFPGYDVLAKRDTPSWNAPSREAIEKRLHEVPPRRFLSEEEWRILEAICARLLPQPDRGAAAVPIVPWLDEMLDEDQGDGTHYAGMPPMREAWRRGIRAIEEEGRAHFGAPFRELPPGRQDDILRFVQQGEVKGTAWDGLPAKRFFTSLLLAQVVAVYYAHPAAWNEIGFGGPASPRGYVRLGFDRHDAWEAEERRER